MKFPKKNLAGCIFLSLSRVELRGSKNLPFFKYYNALEWEKNFNIIPETSYSDYIG